MYIQCLYSMHLALFLQHNSLEVHTGCRIYHDFLAFYCRVIFHGMDVSLFNQTSIEGYFNCFQVWAISNKTSINIQVFMFV